MRPHPLPHAPAPRRAAGPGSAWALLLVLCLAPAKARADNDWLGIDVPRPFDSGSFDVSERVSTVGYVGWQDGGDFSYMVLNGGAQELDLLTLDTRLLWRPGKSVVLEADIPTVFSQLSPYTATPQYYNVGTPGVFQSQGLGDVGLELRGPLLPAPAGGSGDGFQAGWSVQAVAPTGLGPFQAVQPLVGTGAGRWQVVPGLVAGGQEGPWEGWLQARGRLQFGQQAVVSPGSYLDWRANAQGVTQNASLPGADGGGLWLAPRYGLDAVAGLALIWYRGKHSRMGLACEATAHWLSPWATAAGPSGLPAEEYVVLTPELQARYGAYSAVVGWQAQYLWAVETPWTDGGILTFDVSYTF